MGLFDTPYSPLPISAVLQGFSNAFILCYHRNHPFGIFFDVFMLSTRIRIIISENPFEFYGHEKLAINGREIRATFALLGHHNYSPVADAAYGKKEIVKEESPVGTIWNSVVCSISHQNTNQGAK